jgi:hypothetical protein
MKGHPRIPKQIEPYLPGKTGKLIRDKRKEALYKRMLQSVGTNNLLLLSIPIWKTGKQ